MSNETDFDYGPLTDLIGTWKGNKGIDIAPEPDGIENNPYYETIIFEPIGDVTNAECGTRAAKPLCTRSPSPVRFVCWQEGNIPDQKIKMVV